MLQGFYYRIGKFVEKRKFAVSFIIFAITAAFVPILLGIQISINQLLVTPRNAPSLKAFLIMKEYEIPRGLISPINIMVKAPLPQIDTSFRSMPCSDDDIDFKIEADNHYIGEYLQSCSDALQVIPEFCKTKKNCKMLKFIKSLRIYAKKHAQSTARRIEIGFLTMPYLIQLICSRKN